MSIHPTKSAWSHWQRCAICTVRHGSRFLYRLVGRFAISSLPPSPSGLCITHTSGERGPEAPAKNCFRFALAAKPPKQTENNIILAERSPAGSRGRQEATCSTASGCGTLVDHDKPSGRGGKRGVRFPPPLHGAGARGWGNSRDQSVCAM